MEITKHLKYFPFYCLFSIIILYWLFGIWLTFILFFVTTASCFYFLQDLVFGPDCHDSVKNLPNSLGENMFIKSADGTRLHMYIMTRNNSELSVLLLGQREGDINSRLGFATKLRDELKCNIFMIDYRGYGHSEGAPSEKGLYMDAQAGVDYLVTEFGVGEKRKIIVMGHSLGGAVAIDLASKDKNAGKISGIIVENTFTSVPDVIKDLPGLEFTKYIPTFLFKNKFLSLNKIRNVKVPTLFISGGEDKLLKPQMMRELFYNCESTFKRLVSIASADHTNACLQPIYYDNIILFLNNLRDPSQICKNLPYNHNYGVYEV